MAIFGAREDHAYLYLTAADGFGIPDAVFNSLRKTFGADWSKAARELRLPLNAAPTACRWLERSGHQIVRRAVGRIAKPRGPRECALCGHPYSNAFEPDAGFRCVECGDELNLVWPHVCDGSCRRSMARARVQPDGDG